MKRIGMSILSLALLLCLAACGNTNPAASGTAAPETAVPETAAPQEDYDGKLVLDGPMELEYARNFAVDRYKGGYRMCTAGTTGNTYLVVPEGMSVPEELEAGVRAVGYIAVTYNEPYFSGHFPEEPVMPGVLIVEALAQTGAVAVLSMEENKGKTAYFGGMDRVKFKKKVVPGDRLRLECEIIKRKGPVGVGKATATVDGKIAVSAELTFMIG